MFKLKLLSAVFNIFFTKLHTNFCDTFLLKLSVCDADCGAINVHKANMLRQWRTSLTMRQNVISQIRPIYLTFKISHLWPQPVTLSVWLIQHRSKGHGNSIEPQTVHWKQHECLWMFAELNIYICPYFPLHFNDSSTTSSQRLYSDGCTVCFHTSQTYQITSTCFVQWWQT